MNDKELLELAVEPVAAVFNGHFQQLAELEDGRVHELYLHPPQQVAVTSGERAELIARLIRKAAAWDYLHTHAKRPNDCRNAADMLEADAQQTQGEKPAQILPCPQCGEVERGTACSPTCPRRTHNIKAKQVPLSDDKIDTIMRPLTQNTAYSWRVFARAIEAHHGIGGEA